MNLNPVGVNPNFLVDRELVRPSDLLANNLVALKKGSFYRVGLSAQTVEDATPYTDVSTTQIDPDATGVSEQAVYKYLHFPNGLTQDVFVNYYYFDGRPQEQREAFLNTLDGLDREVSSPDYRAIQDKPYALGNKEHDHDAATMYGLESIGVALLTLLGQSNANLDSILSEVLKGIQSGTDNRLKTSSKTLVGAVNEIFSVLDELDVSVIQQDTSTSLNTANKSIVGAINELKSKVTTLDSLLGQGIDFAGEIEVATVTLTTGDNKSRLWAVKTNTTITADFVNSVTSVEAASGDIVFLDGVTQKFHHQNVGGLTTSMLDASTTIAGSGLSVTGALQAIYAALSALTDVNPLNPLLGVIVANTDYSQAPASKTGFYIVGQDGLSLTFGNPAGVISPSAGSTIDVIGGTYDYTVSDTRTILAPELSANMPDTGRVKTIDAFDDLTTLLNHTVSTYGNGFDYAGYLSGGTYDLSNVTGTWLWVFVGTNGSVIIPDGAGTKTVDVYRGDIILRKQTTGEFIITTIGKELASKVSKTSPFLETVSNVIVDALLEVSEEISSVGLVGKNIRDLSSLPINTTDYSTPRRVLGLTSDYDPDDVWIVTEETDFMKPTGTSAVYNFTRHFTGDILIPQGSGWTVYNGSLLLKRCYPELVGPIKTITGEINRLWAAASVMKPYQTGDIFASGELKSPSYALPCDGRVHSMTDHPALGNLLLNQYGGDGVTTFGVPDTESEIVPYKNDITPQHYLEEFIRNDSDRATGSSGEIAVSADGLSMVYIKGIRSSTINFIDLLTNESTAYVTSEGVIRSIVIVPNTNRYYLLVWEDLGQSSPVIKLCVFDPLNEFYTDDFVVLNSNMPSADGVLISNAEDVETVYYAARQIDNTTKLYQVQANTNTAPTEVPNGTMPVDPKRIYTSAYRIGDNVYIGGIFSDQLRAVTFDTGFYTLNEFAIPMMDGLDANARVYQFFYSKTIDLYGFIFTTDDGNTKDYERSMYWLAPGPVLAYKQSFVNDLDKPETQWNSISSAEYNPITGSFYGIVSYNSGERMLMSESTLSRRHYIKT